MKIFPPIGKADKSAHSPPGLNSMSLTVNYAGTPLFMPPRKSQPLSTSPSSAIPRTASPMPESYSPPPNEPRPKMANCTAHPIRIDYPQEIRSSTLSCSFTSIPAV